MREEEEDGGGAVVVNGDDGGMTRITSWMRAVEALLETAGTLSREALAAVIRGSQSTSRTGHDIPDIWFDRGRGGKGVTSRCRTLFFRLVWLPGFKIAAVMCFTLLYAYASFFFVLKVGTIISRRPTGKEWERVGGGGAQGVLTFGFRPPRVASKCAVPCRGS